VIMVTYVYVKVRELFYLTWTVPSFFSSLMCPLHCLPAKIFRPLNPLLRILVFETYRRPFFSFPSSPPPKAPLFPTSCYVRVVVSTHLTSFQCSLLLRSIHLYLKRIPPGLFFPISRSFYTIPVFLFFATANPPYLWTIGSPISPLS